MPSRRRKATSTSSFGSSGRESHDSSPFYASNLYTGLQKEEELAWDENPIPPQYLDTILCKSCEDMRELPDHSVHLMVTSPPLAIPRGRPLIVDARADAPWLGALAAMGFGEQRPFTRMYLSEARPSALPRSEPAVFGPEFA